MSAVADCWLRPAEVSRLTGKSVKTLANMRSEGRGPAWMKLDGGEVVYPESVVLAWRESLVAARMAGAR